MPDTRLSFAELRQLGAYIVALAVAILGAAMFFSSHGVILGTNIQFLSIWIAIIGAVVVAIQWVDDYFKQPHPKGFGN